MIRDLLNREGILAPSPNLVKMVGEASVSRSPLEAANRLSASRVDGRRLGSQGPAKTGYFCPEFRTSLSLGHVESSQEGST